VPDFESLSLINDYATILKHSKRKSNKECYKPESVRKIIPPPPPQLLLLKKIKKKRKKKSVVITFKKLSSSMTRTLSACK
jgi:hypothetical protein